MSNVEGQMLHFEVRMANFKCKISKLEGQILFYYSDGSGTVNTHCFTGII